jgi:hypothetical protein
MNLIKISLLFILATYCSAFISLEHLQLTIPDDTDVIIGYYKTNPIKARKRFFSILSKMGSKDSLMKVRNASAKQFFAYRKVNDAIARRIIKIVNFGAREQVTSFESDLVAKMSYTMSKE